MPHLAKPPVCEPDRAAGDPIIGVAIATYQSEVIITGCLDSLYACRKDIGRIIVTDNASSDATCQTIRNWAVAHDISFAEASAGDGAAPAAWLTLLHSPVNGGFAYATNRGLEWLLRDPQIGLFWLVNPDCLVAPNAAAHYRHAGRDGNFALMGGRTLFEEQRSTIQTDGGRVSRWTGVCSSVNARQPAASAPFPDAATLDYITGANCVASRRFLEDVGLMEEGYFLYYEEVDWAMRRGALPLRTAPDAVVFHYGGTAIGSGTVNRRPSPFSNYFNYRNRIRFMRRHRPLAVPVALAYGLAKALQLLVSGARAEADAVLRGILGLAPPRAVRAMLPPAAHAHAFSASS